MYVHLLLGDCVDRMALMPERSLDLVLSDPPYGLEFMGNAWDRLDGIVLHDPSVVGGFQDGKGGNPFSRARIRYGTFKGKSEDGATPGARVAAWHVNWLNEAFRVLRPGGVIKAFSGSRTLHRLGQAMEEAGFVDVDIVGWGYASGFPKSLDVSKAIDKSKGLERKVVGTKRGVRGADGTGHETAMPGKAVGVKQVACDVPVTAPASPEAEAWDGWGTALKPAWEPVLVGRKP